MLRLLDPERDLELFREAYSWRPSPKKHVQTNRVSFEGFASSDPHQIVIGVFTHEFVAAFVFYEYDPKRYECHFTSRRYTSHQVLLEAGHEIIQSFFENGTEELTAWIIEKNRPLRAFVESLGFSLVETKDFDGKPFVRYSLFESK